jgi:hypothetical protein
LLNTDEVSFQLEIKLIPNPAHHVVTIQKPENLIIYNINIYNILGQHIGEFSDYESIDISNLSSGLHFLKLETNYGTFHKSLLKQ